MICKYFSRSLGCLFTFPRAFSEMKSLFESLQAVWGTPAWDSRAVVGLASPSLEARGAEPVLSPGCDLQALAGLCPPWPGPRVSAGASAYFLLPLLSLWSSFGKTGQRDGSGKVVSSSWSPQGTLASVGGCVTTSLSSGGRPPTHSHRTPQRGQRPTPALTLRPALGTTQAGGGQAAAPTWLHAVAQRRASAARPLAQSVP